MWMCLADSKKINEEELQELFPEGLYKSLSFPCLYVFLYLLFNNVFIDINDVHLLPFCNLCCAVS